MAAMHETDENSLQFGDEIELNPKGSSMKHPFVSFFHIAFRTVALVVYLFCELFSNSFIISFIFILAFLSADFWTVKNVSGRLLVGLRWWNHVDENGDSVWYFESRNKSHAKMISSKEAGIFWIGLIVTPLIWAVFFFVALFSLKFKWLIVACVALGLSVANLYGYLRCKSGNSEGGITGMARSFFGRQVVKAAASSVETQS